MNTTTPRRRGRPPGSKNKPKSSPSGIPHVAPAPARRPVDERKAATYKKRLVALEKARAARSAKRAAAGIVTKPRTTTATSTDQPTSGPQPYLLSDDYRLVALDHRNWALQKLRTSGDAASGEDGENEGEEGATDTWFSVGYFASIQAACSQFAQRSAREAHGATLPAAIAQACKQLNKLLVDIGEATKQL